MAPNQLLKKWIEAQKISAAEAARRVEYDRSNFHRILAGQAAPTIDLAGRIEAATNGAVPISAWLGFEPTRTTEPQRAVA